MRAMILTAGRGERLRPLTDTTPKALIEVAGKPLVVHMIERLRAAGIEDLVINLGWLGAKIRAALGGGERFGVAIHYSDEGENTLETAGGVLNALPLLGEEPFWVVAADVWTDYPFAKVRLGPNDLAHFVLVDNPDHNDGDFTLVADRVHDSDGGSASECLTYAGIGLYHPEFFAGERIERKPLLPLMRHAVRAGRVAGEHYRGRWADIGTPERLAAARTL
ncbi:MAG: nucleotidyltransferase family protein [Gammaproteobacteria bacterium]|nr:nucleotidyltransferase family protein [Gammaproteobacteria bacterium]